MASSSLYGITLDDILSCLIRRDGQYQEIGYIKDEGRRVRVYYIDSEGKNAYACFSRCKQRGAIMIRRKEVTRHD